VDGGIIRPVVSRAFFQETKVRTEYWMKLSLVLVVVTIIGLTIAQCAHAEDVTYTSSANLDGSYTTRSSDGGETIARPCATCASPSYTVYGRDGAGNEVRATVSGHATDKGYTTTVKK
jgi:hypothetical protein